MNAILEVTTVYVKAEYIRCPYCQAEQDGWVHDPRGAVEKCEDCGETYSVHPDADMELA